jgi:hypothetical protein
VVANLLARPLPEQRLEEQHLAEVQCRREFSTRFIQGFQGRCCKSECWRRRWPLPR